MTNAKKHPEESPNKKSKTKHIADNSALDFFLEPLWQSLQSFNSRKCIEAPPSSVARESYNASSSSSSRYDNAPSLFDLVQTNLLRTTSPAAASTSASTSDSSTIPQKRSQLQITQEKAVAETDTLYHTPPADFASIQISLDTQESRSNQITTTKTEYNAIVLDSGTSNVSKPRTSDTQNLATSTVADVTGHSQSLDTSNNNNTHIIHVSNDDNTSNMSIGQDNEEMENTNQNPDRIKVSVVADELDHQASIAIASATPTITQHQSSGASLNKTTSYHSLELYEDIDNDQDEFVDTSEILIDVEAEEDELSQSSDEFYDVKEVFSATVSRTTTPTIAEEEANRQLQDDTTLAIMNVFETAVEAVQATDVEDNGDEQSGPGAIDVAEEDENMDQEEELADNKDELDQEEEEEADQLTEEGHVAQVEDTEQLGDIAQVIDDALMQANDVEAHESEQGLDKTRKLVEILQEGESLDVASTQESDANESGQSVMVDGDPSNVLEDGDLDTNNESLLDRVDDDSNEHDRQPNVIEAATVDVVELQSDKPGNDVQQQQQQQQPSGNEETEFSVEHSDPVAVVDDQAVAPPSMQDEQLNQSEPLNQNDQLPSFGMVGMEDEQLIDIEEVHLLMDHQDEQMALNEPLEEEATFTTLPEASILNQQDEPPSAAVNTTHADSPEHDQQVQLDDDTNESDQQVINGDPTNTTGSQLLQCDQVHSFLLEEIQEILQEDSEEAEEQQQGFAVENKPTPPLPAQNQDNHTSTTVAGDSVDVVMLDAIVELEPKAILSESQSQVASAIDDSIQDIATVRDSFALDLIQSQTPFSQQAEELEEYELEEFDELVEDTQEPDVVVKTESNPTATATAQRTFFDLTNDSEEADKGVCDMEFIDMGPMDGDGEDENDLTADAVLEEESEKQDIQTQEPVAVALDDVPLSCLKADMDAMGGRIVCNMDLPPYANVSMWWYDAHDSNQKGIVYLFGKVFDDQQDKYVSCCVRIKNVVRELYILPRQFQIDDEGNPTHIRVHLNDVQQELKVLLEHKRISNYRMTTCEKQYVFSGTDIPRKATYIKLQYSYKDYEFPTTQSGKTFSHIFGANTSPLEHFLIQHDIMGPCWLDLVQCTKLDNDLSWCALNIGLEDPQCCSVLQEEGEAPPLNVMSLSLQTQMSRLGAQSNQVVAVSLFLCKDVNVDTLDYTTDLNGYRSTIICLPPNMSYPADAYESIESTSQHIISLENTEFALLSRLLAAIHVYDPDIISGHNFFGGDLDTLLTRMKQLRVPHWHKLGRFKSKMLSKTSGNSEGSISSTSRQRLHMRGRIVCDTFEASQDLIKSKSFHLSELAKTQLDIVRTDIKPQQLDSYFKTGHQLLALAKHCSLDAYITFALMTKLQILPLTKQLTRLSGNLWSHSIHGARSERNEYLLLHTFYKRGYLCPDKPVRPKKHSFEFVDEALELELPASKRRLGANGKETPSFEGGLVLDPKTGIYDKYVLLLDFNSLYPSIMQEFNVCFTTMDVNADAIDTKAPRQTTTMGILPELVKMFVDRRKRVKQLMSDPSISATARAQYHIEQMGLKLTANSMYGCLGSSYSRFFARPLAAFITGKGRDILRDTVQIAERSSGVDVIYGDTDSIMVNTHQTVLSRANKIGQQLKDLVNTKYTMLEIDIDGVFRRTLLLKKKKYAAQVVTQLANGSYKEALEIKGLDIVRRDGCDLSRETSEHVLQLILSSQPQETIVNDIHQYIKMVANRVRASQVPVHAYIIRKQLTKSPEEYRTTKGNPHVLVAKDMRRSGIAVKSGDTIPYIYCTKTLNNGVVVREPRMPDDVYNDKAVIDKDWYLLKQVLPSVARICIPLEGTNRTKLTEYLQINTPQPSAPAPAPAPTPPNTDNAMQVDSMPVIEEEIGEEDENKEEEEEEEKEEEEEEKENSANSMLVNVFKIKGQHRSKRLALKCSACDRRLPPNRLTCACGASLSVASLYCQTLVAVRRLIQMYYASPHVCNESACGFETRDQFPVDDVCCLQMNCPGKLIRQYSAGQLYDQIASFKDTIKHLGDQGQDVSLVLAMLHTMNNKSAYNYIDLNSFV